MKYGAMDFDIFYNLVYTKPCEEDIIITLIYREGR